MFFGMGSLSLGCLAGAVTDLLVSDLEYMAGQG
uniref:Imelysin ICMP, outer membrane (Fragments) n=1 Tax=Pseudomonas aeruginosa TaxID=287 RepID=Q7M0Z6_PSEAI